MRFLLERIQYDWNILNNAREIEIMKKYSAIGRFITLLVICKNVMVYMTNCENVLYTDRNFL